MMLKNYNYFLEIERQRSITKASETLYITQPSLSKYLNKLEGELGVNLFDRSFTPLKLTKAGSLYLEFVNKYSHLERSFLSDLDNFQGPFETVTIGIASWRGSFVIPHIYREFLPDHPNYSIEFKEGPGSYTQQLLENNKVDFCLMNVVNNTCSINLDCMFLDNEEVCVAMSKEHPFLKNSKESENYISEVDLKQLENETFIMLQDSQNLSKKVQQIFEYLEVRPKKIIKTQNLNTALNIASNSHGITFYPYSNKLNQSVINEDLISLKIKGDNSMIPFALICNKSSDLSDACKSSINFIFSMYGLNKTI